MVCNRVTGISFEIAGHCVGMHSARSIPSFVHPQFSASIGAGGNRQVEAVVLSYLPGVRAGARADRGGNFGNPLVAVRINLLVHKDEALSTGDVNSLAVGVVRHIVCVDRARKAGNLFACIHVQHQQTRRFAGRNEQAAMRLIERHGKVCPGFFQFPIHNFAGISVNDGDLADGGEIDKNLRAFLLELKRLWMGSDFIFSFETFIGGGVENPDGAFVAIAVTDVNAFRNWVITKLVGIVGKFYRIDQFVGVGVEESCMCRRLRSRPQCGSTREGTPPSGVC